MQISLGNAHVTGPTHQPAAIGPGIHVPKQARRPPAQARRPNREPAGARSSVKRAPVEAS